MKQLHVVQGDAVDDRRFLERRARTSKKSDTWILPRSVAVGDDVLIYIVGIGLYATAEVAGPVHKRKDWKNRYGAPLHKIRLISPPISLAQIQSAAPTFRWTKYPRSITTTTGIIAAQLRRLVIKRRRGLILTHHKLVPGLNVQELKSLASNGPAKKMSKKVWCRVRDARIRAYALERAGGVCDGCRKDAPFAATSGRPFLEVHHVARLSDDGLDHPRNVVALCPNCHRRAHYSADAIAFNKRLKTRAHALFKQ